MPIDTEACIGPQQARAFPNDIELELFFPREIQDEEQKIIYTLWREGEQSYSNLLLLTGVSEEDLSPILRKLQREGRISATQFKRTCESQEQFVYTIFSLVTK